MLYEMIITPEYASAVDFPFSLFFHQDAKKRTKKLVFGSINKLANKRAQNEGGEGEKTLATEEDGDEVILE